MNSLIATDKYTLIVGTGVTGQSVARYLNAKGKRFSFFDTRANPPGIDDFRARFADVPVYLQNIDHSILCSAEEIVLSPGVSRQHSDIAKAIAAGVPVVGDISVFLRENAARQNPAKVIGVTGSNGKTTVTTLLGMAAQAEGLHVAVGGNIGTPALDLLAQNAALVVLELSSFQLESINKAGLDVACVLNVSEDHMDRYDSFVQYAMTKQRIYFAAKHVVYNIDEPLTIPPVVEKTQRIGFGYATNKEEYEKKYTLDTVTGAIFVGANKLIDREQIKLQGSHNLLNVCALFALCDAAGISQHAAIKVVKNFAGLPHRCEWVAQKHGVTYVNDSKATNVGAAVAALNGFADHAGNIVLIAGGDGKDARFDVFGQTVDRYVKHLVLLGRDANRIADTVADPTRISFVASLEEGVALAAQKALANDIVLLSPACASFDMFTGYEQRGEVFRSAVMRLAS